MLIFGATEALIAEGGLLAVTVAGLICGSRQPPALRGIVEFKSVITDLLISFVFILLTARLQLQQFIDFGPKGFLLVALVIFLIRPLYLIDLLFGLLLLLRINEPFAGVYVWSTICYLLCTTTTYVPILCHRDFLLRTIQRKANLSNKTTNKRRIYKLGTNITVLTAPLSTKVSHIFDSTVSYSLVIYTLRYLVRKGLPEAYNKTTNHPSRGKKKYTEAPR